ncbi:hypothetical protein B5K06_24815 [Rhizobium grahamii]|uniref:Uncharacterized protein n=1 Tax=Rhizobium grahamii TaxID=1120045 RepID=A0A370KIF8_9HYPH|nr:hypothetical protein B5K06_24815 [Rhizobium grahamii]
MVTSGLFSHRQCWGAPELGVADHVSVETGSYRQSIIAVAEGAADVAAIDCKTFADGYGLSQVRLQPSPQRGQSQEKKGRRKTAAHKV